MNTLKFGNGEWYGKEGTILAYNDENSNYKPLPFDFSRASKATVINKDGLIEQVGSGEPRIDYKDSAEGALLLEPQSTNLIQYSSDISQSFNPVDITETQNYGIAPNGNNESTRVQLISSTSHYWKNYTLTNGSEYTASFYYKGIEGETTYIKALTTGGGSGNNRLITFSGDWQREELTFTAGSTTSYIYIADNRAGADNTATDFEVWGAQLEQGSYATSYIPTQGSAVTRLADSCSQTPPDGVIGQTEGTLYVEYSALSNDLSYRSIGLNSGSALNRLLISFNNISNNINFLVQVGGVTQVSINYSGSDITSSLKLAFGYKENDFVAYVNGTQVGTDTSGSTYTSGTLTTFSFDNAANADRLFAKLKEAKLYNTRLSNSELAALTS